MLEKPYTFTRSEAKTIEQVVDLDEVMINHMILPRGAALPQHNANSNVFMTVVRGRVTLQLDDQEAHAYDAGQIIEIPFRTLMNVSNQDDAVLELFVIKAPGPRTMNNPA